MKIYSWNVNGIRAAIRKGFEGFLEEHDPDIICLQETKAHREQVDIDFDKYIEHWNSAERKGYSGTAIFTKEKPISIINDIVIEGKVVTEMKDKYGDPNNEGRVLTLEFDKFFLTTVYTPNSKGDLTRLDLRYKKWDVQFLKMMKELEKKKTVIFCGDLNVAHQEIDLARPDSNVGKHGFTDEERERFGDFMKAGFIDTYRELNPDTTDEYSWWSNFGGARKRNVGWRIDYFCISKALKKNLKKAYIMSDVMGSDHAPVGIDIEL